MNKNKEWKNNNDSQFNYFVNPCFTKLFGTHTFYQGGQRGGGVGQIPYYLKNCCHMNLKFCRALQTIFYALEMLKLFTLCLLGYHSNSSKERCFIGEIAIFQAKIPII